MADARNIKKTEQGWEKLPNHNHSFISVGIWLTKLMIGKFRNNKSYSSEDHVLGDTRTFPHSEKVSTKKNLQLNGSKSTNLETELPDCFDQVYTSSAATVHPIIDEIFVPLISKNIEDEVPDQSRSNLNYCETASTPKLRNQRIYDPLGPVNFSVPPTNRTLHERAEIRPWNSNDNIVSQNSSKRRVHRAYWLSSVVPDVIYPAAIKFVEDKNAKDGRSIKREIECHLYIYKHLKKISLVDNYEKVQDAWPCSELLGYHLDNKEPGNCVLITRKLSGNIL